MQRQALQLMVSINACVYDGRGARQGARGVGREGEAFSKMVQAGSQSPPAITTATAGVAAAAATTTTITSAAPCLYSSPLSLTVTSIRPRLLRLETLAGPIPLLLLLLSFLDTPAHPPYLNPEWR